MRLTYPLLYLLLIFAMLAGALAVAGGYHPLNPRAFLAHAVPVSAV